MIIINTIKRKTGMWAFPNVCQKNTKIFPLFADFYSATSIVFILIVVWVVAALMHHLPNVVDGMSIFDFSVPMTETSIIASARSSQTPTKRDAKCDMLVAAIALTEPLGTTVFIQPTKSNHDQSAKSLVCHINALSHNHKLT